MRSLLAACGERFLCSLSSSGLDLFKPEDLPCYIPCVICLLGCVTYDLSFAACIGAP